MIQTKASKILLIMTLVSLANANCDAKCVACSTTGKCIICNAALGFFLKGEECKKVVVDQCSSYQINGSCLSCAGNYYLEKEINKCIPVSTENLDSNCTSYENNSCQTCAENFYPVSGKCLEVPTDNRITDCLTYGVNQKCLVCKGNTSVNLKGDACLANPTDSNCQAFSTVKCTECTNSRILLPDFYQVYLQNYIQAKTQNLTQSGVDKFDKISRERVSNYIRTPTFCIDRQVTNCTTFLSFDKCSQCNTGYYLKNNLCYEYQKQPISNCFKYSNLTTCVECQQGFFLQSSNQCTAVVAIPNCELYSGTLNTTTCIQCQKTHYLANLNNEICKLRTNQVQNCEIYHTSLDKCSSCFTTTTVNILTTDGLKCLPEILYCQTYHSSTVSDTQLKCNVCQDTYHTDSVELSCMEGTVTNCRVYQSQLNKCSICQNKFYLENDICKPHSAINGCMNYSPTVQNACSECQENYLLFNQENECISSNIVGCQTLATATTCSTCEDGYDKVSNTECKLLATSTNCLRAVNGVCSQCIPGYRLENNTCILPYQFENSECDKFDSSAANCEYCQQNSVPYELNEKTTCVQNSRLLFYQSAGYLVPNCEIYKFTNNAISDPIICAQCEAGYNLTGTNCIQGCTNPQDELPFNLLTGTGGSMLDLGIDCQTIVGSKKTTYDSTLIKVKGYDETIQVRVDHTKSSDYLFQIPKNINNAQDNNLYRQPLFTDYVDDAVDQFIVPHDTECQFYEKIIDLTIATTLTDHYSCLRCKYGYNGEIQHLHIPNCHIYHATDIKCDTCYHQHELQDSGKQCVLINIDACARYVKNMNQCEACREGFYLDSPTSCMKNTVQNCRFKSVNKNECELCESNYLLKGDKTECQRHTQHCVTHVFNVGGDETNCSFCYDGYYIDGTTKCVRGTTPNCWRYDQTNTTETCLLYDNHLTVTEIDTCVAPEQTINGCKIYQTELICQECEVGYYKILDVCCEDFKIPTGAINTVFDGTAGIKQCAGTDAANPKCQEFTTTNDADTVFTCQTCKKGTYKVDGVELCCDNGDYYDGTVCKSTLEMDSSAAPFCEVMDTQTFQCVACVAGQYISQGKCSLDNFFNDAAGVNAAIPVGENCIQRKDDGTCKKCAATHLLHPTTFTCQLPKLNCQTEDLVADICLECIPDVSPPDYYMAPSKKGCCEKINQFYNVGTNTCDAPTAIANCEEYSDGTTCIKCNATTYLDNNLCQPLNIINDTYLTRAIVGYYNFCTNIDYGTDYPTPGTGTIQNQCKACVTGKYVSQTQCIDQGNHYLVGASTVIPTLDNCLEYDDAATMCTKCVTGFYKDLLEVFKCVPVKTAYWVAGDAAPLVTMKISENCLANDATDFSCKNSEIAPSVQDFGMGCLVGLDGFYTRVVNTDGCCPEQSIWDNTTKECIALTAGNHTNCRVIKDATDCLICLPGFLLVTGACVAMVTPNDTLYIKKWNISNDLLCKDGFAREEAAGTPVYDCLTTLATCAAEFAADPNCHTFNTAAACVCLKCREGYFLNTGKCYLYGQSFDANYVAFHSQKEHCAVINPATGDCLSCFVDDNDDKCFIDTDYDFRVQYGTTSVLFVEDATNEQTAFKAKFIHLMSKRYLDTTTKQCCLMGQYYSTTDNACVAIPISNCLEGNNTACKRCSDGYHLSNDNCCKEYESFVNGTCQYDLNSVCTSLGGIINDATVYSYYYSGDQLKCCPETTYWDSDYSKCMPHPDPNCLQSSDAKTCEKCKNDYEVSPWTLGWRVKRISYNKRCKKPDMVFSYKMCVFKYSTQTTSSITNHQRNLKLDQCAYYDPNGNTCTTYLDTAYEADATNKYYCEKNFVLFDNKICLEKSKVFGNCKSVNQGTYKCEACLDGYSNQEGICCANGTYLDKRTWTCSINFANCSDYSIDSQYCLKCQNGYYFSSNNEACCMEGQFYDQSTKTCKTFTAVDTEACLRADDDQNCYKCVSDDLNPDANMYAVGGKCCASGQVFDSTNQKCVSQDSVDYANNNTTFGSGCEFFYSNNVCKKCLPNYHQEINQPFCCLNGSYPDLNILNANTFPIDPNPLTTIAAFDYNTCTSSVQFSNCQVMSKSSGALLCTTCETNYYLSDGHCCLDGETWNATKADCVKISKSNDCKTLDKDGNCSSCASGFYLSKQVDLLTTGVPTSFFGAVENLNASCVKNESVLHQVEGIPIKITDYAASTGADAIKLPSDCIAAHLDQNGGTPIPLCYQCTSPNIVVVVASSRAVSCAASPAGVTNCDLYLDDSANTDTDTACLVCKDGFYKSENAQKDCCAENSYWDGTACILYTTTAVNDSNGTALSNCLRFSKAAAVYDCIKCASGFFYDSNGTNPKCKAENASPDSNNCLQVKYDGTCKLCNEGYHIDNTNPVACIQTNMAKYPTPANCRGGLDNANPLTCIGCKNGFHQSGNGCCGDDEYFDDDVFDCMPMQVASNLRKCKQYSDSKCQSCDIISNVTNVGNQTIGFRCCMTDYVWSTDTCVSTTAADTADCKYLEDATTCRNPITSLGEVGPSCDNGKYLSSNRCCAVTQFFDNTACAPISLPGQACNKLDINGRCEECVDTTNNYISNGVCVQFVNAQEFYDGSAVVAINQTNYPNCNKFDSGVCISCSNGVLSNRCCPTTYFNEAQSKCLSLDTNCAVQNPDGICTKCSPDFALSGGKCCAQNFTSSTFEYYNGTACAAIGITDCVAAVDLNGAAYCTVCDPNKHLIASNGSCCSPDQYYSIEALKCVAKEQMLDSCTSFDIAGKDCSMCSTGLYIQKGVCCAEGTKLNVTTGKCEPLTKNCLQIDLATNQCNKCQSGYYKALDDQCCLIGSYFPTGGPCEPVKIHGCNGYDTNGNCTSCSYGNTSTWDGFCCPDMHFAVKAVETNIEGNYTVGTQFQMDRMINVVASGPNFTVTTTYCLPVSTLESSCEAIKYGSTTETGCLKCAATNYLISDLKICIADNSQINYTTLQQEAIPAHENCIQKVNNKCIKCAAPAANHPNFYLHNDHCCPEEYYWDNEQKKCNFIQEDGCLQYIDGDSKECKVCETNTLNYHLSQKHCCLEGFYYDTTQKMCTQPIDYCKTYEDSATAKCTECYNNTNIFLTADQQQCCIQNSFIDSNGVCHVKPFKVAVLPYCLDWDKVTLHCTSCVDHYYLSQNKCVEHKKFIDSGTKVLGPITIPNCLEIQDADNTICQKCEDNYKYEATNKVCVQNMSDCIFEFFTPNAGGNTCTKCTPNHYVSTNICCPYGQANDNSGTCVNITIANCASQNLSTDTTCVECKEQHYLVNGNQSCIPHGQFYNAGTPVAGQVLNCQEYSTSDVDCVKCEDSHALIDAKVSLTAATTKKYCFPKKIQNCVTGAFAANGGANLNPYSCVTCDPNYFLKSLAAPNTVIHSYQVHEESCIGYETKLEYQDSTFNCAKCTPDKYLDVASQTCVARTAAFTANCRRPLNDTEDKCGLCEYDYYLDANFQCVSRISTNTADSCKFKENASDCFACHMETHHLIVDTSRANDLKCSNIAANHANENDHGVVPSHFPAYIKKCEENLECKNEVLNGLDPNLQKYASCHVCHDPTRVPFISLDIDTSSNNNVIQGISRYSTFNANTLALDVENLNKEGFSSACLSDDFSQFNLPAGSDETTQFPDNCGLIVLNSNKVINFQEANNATPDINKISAFCGACKPGFKATYSDKDYHIYDCTAIANCSQSGKAFNMCDHCSPGFSFEYKSNVLNRFNCVDSTTNPQTNCYAIDVDNDKCMICDQGYSTNHEGKCEKLKINQCSGNFHLNKFLPTTAIDLIYYRGYNGCQACQTGYTKFTFSTTPNVCLNSPYVTNTATFPNTTAYIQGCVQYKSLIPLQCQVCSTGTHIVTTVGGCITKNSNHNSCSIAFDANTCQTCDSGFILDSTSKCQAESIENCLTYQPSVTPQQCLTCIPGYVVSNNTCILGTLTHCNVYSNTGDCTSCQSGHQLITLQNNIQYCYPIVTTDQCTTYNNQVQQKHLKCTGCPNNQIISPLTPVKTTCQRLQNIEYCIQYDKRGSTNFDFNQVTLQCQKCRIDYYLTNNTCHKRLNLVSNCDVYDDNADQCNTCEANYFLENNKCEKNPTGIANCKDYSDQDVCQRCLKDYYLQNNVCVAVDSTKILQNCDYYSQEQICLECTSNFLFENNQCVAKVINNCIEYENSGRCKVCDVGFGLQEVANGVQCTNIQTIANCQTQSQNSPYNCTKCNSGFVLNTDNTACEQVTTPITNCIDYMSQTQCSKCATDYIVVVDKLSCIKTELHIDCGSLEEQSTPFCAACKAGFTMNDSFICIQDTAGPQNCLVKQIGTDKCIVCVPEAYMNQNNECQLINIPENEFLPIINPIQVNANILIFLTQAFLLVIF